MFAAIAVVFYAVKEKLFVRGGSLFVRFLVFWMIVNITMYSSYGEKMPQLSLNVVVPAILLAGMFIGRILQALDWEWARPWVARIAPSWAVAAEATDGVVSSKKASKKAAKKARRRAVRSGGKPRLAHAVFLLALILLFSYNLRVSFQANYHTNDDRPEMIHYAHISFDTREIMAQIEDYARKTGQGKGVSISQDSSEGAFSFVWSWYWYLRDYTSVQYIDCSKLDSTPPGDILLIKKKHDDAAQPYLDKYGEGQEFRHMLWFTEQYKTDPFSDNLKAWWHYFFDRMRGNPWWGDEEGIITYWGSGQEGVIYFPKNAP
jgi:predicted membrane-bound mannosyltransferase